MDHGLTGFFPLPARCRFALTGPDSTRYLSGQVTNRVEGIGPNETRYACVTNAKGQLEADIYLTYWPDLEAYVIESDGRLRDDLLARLDRYLIADDAAFDDISDAWSTIHLFGDELATVQRRFDGGSSNGRLFENDRFGLPGVDLVVPAADRDADLEQLRNDGQRECDPLAIDALRIARGIPVWGRELTPGLLPPEARLEKRAIAYEKGCYIGQEVISRMKRAGKTNRLLCLFRTVADSEPLRQLREGDLLLVKPDDPSEKPLGTLTSVNPAPVGEIGPGRLALGYLKSAQARPGTVLHARSPEDPACTAVQVLQYPASTPA